MFLRSLLVENTHMDIEWAVGYLRDRLTEHPPEGYKTWAECEAELDAAKAAS